MTKVIQGDCLVELKSLEENSIDSIVTDPPYELGFMGKSWDNTGIANNPEMWKECLRVLKPGGYLLSFGGTRTYHRMVVAIEDAGFEVRDMIEWVYGSGFPKSLNIGKAVDKLQGNERYEYNPGGRYNYSFQEGNSQFVSETATKSGKRMSILPTKGTSEWEGWGTALKPAHEPICMARKPLAEKTVVENVLKYGTGGINIDESRVGTEERTYGGMSAKKPDVGTFRDDNWVPKDIEVTVNGRFPANLIHDNSEEVRECFPETGKGGYPKLTKEFTGQSNITFRGAEEREERINLDSGNASRFFKSIKTDKICSLCCLPFNDEYAIMSVCKNTNVNNVEKSLETTQVITESTALKSATQKASKNLAQTVKSVGNLCDLCGTYIAQWIVEPKIAQSQESILGQVSITEPKLQILKQCLASFVELRGNTDTIPTMENLNLLFGYVFNAIENYTQKCEDIKSEGKNQWKSLIYKSKASKSERNKGCEELEDKDGGCLDGNSDMNNNRKIGANPSQKVEPTKNNHPTVKPLALMEYLIKMVTPKGGIVLDPFAGSGSTLVAAKQNGFQYVGIEMTEEYIPIIEARLNEVQQTLL